MLVCGVGDDMESTSVAAQEQSHSTKMESVTKENCSPTESSSHGQSRQRSTTNPDTLQDASASFANKMPSEKCRSDQTEVESSQKLHTQTSVPPALGTDFVQTSQPGGVVLLPDARRRPISYNFAGTRHESYGNLGIASLAGLSSTSATLALLPLQASGPSRTTTLPSPPVPTSTVTGSSSPPLADVVSSSGTKSLESTGVGLGGKLGAASVTAASVKDRRSTFFSEPPKPISLPTRSASQLSSQSDFKPQLLTAVSSPGVRESNGPSLTVTSVPRSTSQGSFNSLSTATALETQSSSPSSLQQQDRPSLTAESSHLCPEMPHQRGVSPMQFSDHSVTSASDGEDTNFSVWCGPPPADAAAVEPADTCIFEMGEFF